MVIELTVSYELADTKSQPIRDPSPHLFPLQDRLINLDYIRMTGSEKNSWNRIGSFRLMRSTGTHTCSTANQTLGGFEKPISGSHIYLLNLLPSSLYFIGIDLYFI